MRTFLFVMAASAALCVRAEAAPDVDVARGGPATKIDERAARAVMNRLPLAFEANRGQAPNGWDFLVRCRGYHAFVRSSGIVFSFDGAPLAMSIEGADQRAPTTDGLELPGRVNYFLGNDSTKWVTEIPVVRGARYEDVAPATSWSVGGRGRALEFAFDLAPGADAPRLRFDGARGVRVAEDGSLRVAMPGGEATIAAPVAWQDTGAGRVDARAKFVVEKDGVVRVATSPRDPDRSVRIDPTVTYESYLGSTLHDECGAAAIDASGAAYFGGYTTSTTFPTTAGAYQTSLTVNTGSGGHEDWFVTKVNASGSALVYSTFVGGLKTEYLSALAVDSSGAVFAAGNTFSTDFPTTGAGPTGSQPYGLLAKLGPTGATLAFSTYVPRRYPNSVALRPSGGVYVSDGDEGLALYSATGAELFFHPITGTGQNKAVATDANGDAYVVGYASASAFATTAGAFQTARAGSNDGFLTKIASNSTVVFTTLLGGASIDIAYAVDVNLAGQAYVAGSTKSSNFPVTANAYRSAITTSNTEDAFVSRFAADGSSLRYSTYLGSGEARGVRAHAASSYVVAGMTPSASFPVVNAFQPTSTGDDGFVLKFNRDNSIAWSSFCGGSGGDYLFAVGMGPDGTIAASGATNSSDLPTSNAYQSASGGGDYDAFLLKIPDNLPTTLAPVAIATTSVPTWTVGYPYAAPALAASGGLGSYAWSLSGGALPATMTITADGYVTGTPPQVGVYTFKVRVLDSTELTAERQFTLLVNPPPSISSPTLAGGTLDTPYDRPLPIVDGSGAMTCSITAGVAPPGLTLASDGRLTGTPTQLGDFPFTVHVVDGLGASGSGQVSLHMNPRPVINATATPDWTSTRAYVAQSAAVGGTPPLVWTVASGAVPATLAADTGRISGPAKAAGAYAFTLRVTDANGATAERAYAATINAYPEVANAVAPRIAVGRPCGVQPVLSGGTAPFQWARTVGELPAGLSVDPATGEIVGVSTAASSGEVQIECIDAAGAASAGHFFLTTSLPVDLVKKRAAETVVLTLQSPPSVERYVELTANARLSVAVTGGGSAAGGPRLRLYDASGAELDLAAFTKSTPKSVTLRKFVVPATGRYFLAVLPALGSVGKMKVTTTIAPPATWTSSGAVGPAATSEYVFAAPPGSFLSISAKSVKPSLALPRIVSVVAPDGADLAPAGKTVEKGRTAAFALKTPLAGGDYRVTFGPRDANAGAVSWTVRLRMPGRYTFALPELVSGE